MKLPRDLSGAELAKALRVFGYYVVRQTGSHVRLRTLVGGEHSVTVPLHNPLRLGTLSGVMLEVASHFKISRDEIVESLFSG